MRLRESKAFCSASLCKVPSSGRQDSHEVAYCSSGMGRQQWGYALESLGFVPVAFSQTLFMEIDFNLSPQMEEKQMFAIQCVLGQGLCRTDEMGQVIQ